MPFNITNSVGRYAKNGGINIDPFMVIGNDTGKIVTSADGNIWALKDMGTFESINGIAYGAGLWVAVGNSSNLTWTSTNGTTWGSTPNTIFTQAGGIGFGKDGAGANLWVAVGGTSFIGSSPIATSPNGTTWTTRTNVGLGTNCLADVAFGKDNLNNNLWVAVVEGNNGNTFASSPNGTDWTGRGIIIYNPRGVAFGKNDSGANLWVATGRASGSNHIAISSNGTTSWTGISATGGITSGKSVAYGKDGSGVGLWGCCWQWWKQYCNFNNWNSLDRSYTKWWCYYWTKSCIWIR
jgi:hypothetical protein